MSLFCRVTTKNKSANALNTNEKTFSEVYSPLFVCEN